MLTALDSLSKPDSRNVNLSCSLRQSKYFYQKPQFNKTLGKRKAYFHLIIEFIFIWRRW